MSKNYGSSVFIIFLALSYSGFILAGGADSSGITLSQILGNYQTASIWQARVIKADDHEDLWVRVILEPKKKAQKVCDLYTHTYKIAGIKSSVNMNNSDHFMGYIQESYSCKDLLFETEYVRVGEALTPELFASVYSDLSKNNISRLPSESVMFSLKHLSQIDYAEANEEVNAVFINNGCTLSVKYRNTEKSGTIRQDFSEDRIECSRL